MIVIGVVGAGSCSSEEARTAVEIGKEIARRGSALVCGGLGGIMEAACKGASEAGGLTIGILPGGDRESANEYVHIPIVTDIGHARNVLIAHTAQAIIAMPGEYGTVSEVALALKIGRPVVMLTGWCDFDGTYTAHSPIEAVDRAFELIN